MNSTWLRVNTLRTSSNRSSVAILCADPDNSVDEILGGLQTLRRRQLELVADLNDIAPVQPPLRHLQLIVVGRDPFHLWVRGPVVPWVHDRILPKVECDNAGRVSTASTSSRTASRSQLSFQEAGTFRAREPEPGAGHPSPAWACSPGTAGVPAGLPARLFPQPPEKPSVSLWEQRVCQKRPDFTFSVGVWEENSATSPMEAPCSRSPAGPCSDACCSGPARSSTTSPRVSSAGPSGSIRSS